VRELDLGASLDAINDAFLLNGRWMRGKPAARRQDLVHDLAAENHIACNVSAILGSGGCGDTTHQWRDDAGLLHEDGRRGLVFLRPQQADDQGEQGDCCCDADQ
jgi:hypothetical protein